jgi:hypothetical protein
MGRRVGAGLVLFQKLEVEITANEINYLVTFTDFEKINVSGSSKDLTIRQLAFFSYDPICYAKARDRPCFPFWSCLSPLLYSSVQ